MGYRIVYGKDPVCRTAPGKGRLRMMTAAAMLVFVLLVRCAWPQGRDTLRKVLLPEEQMVTAFEEMVDCVHSGEEIGEAVVAFCRTVVAGEATQ